MTVVGGCDRTGLTRSSAHEALAKSDIFSAPIVMVGTDSQTESRLSAEGMMERRRDDRKPWERWTLTPKGARLFKDPPSFGGMYGYGGIRLREALHREVVTVTGITDGTLPATKLVECHWRLANVPQVLELVRADIRSPHIGRAEMRLFDDGWRVTAFHEGAVVASSTN